jgi:hypothetical protein
MAVQTNLECLDLPDLDDIDIVMAENDELDLVLSRAKEWFKNKIVIPHYRNTQKLVNASAFNINVFLVRYLSQFLTGAITPEGIARALVIPRALGPSITTTFGTQIQSFIVDVIAGAFGSVSSGIDIEFVDKIDGRRKYLQAKLGPNTINKDDVESIAGHFSDIHNRARLNKVDVRLGDLAIGVMYGAHEDLNNWYLSLEQDKHFSLYVGLEFWERLTGYPDFMSKLEAAFWSVLEDVEVTDLLESVVQELAKDPIIIELATPQAPS